MSKFKLNLAQILSIIIFFYSCIVMAGWIFNIDPLTRILPDQINMKFTTAFAFFMSSISLLLIDLTMRGKKEISQVILPAIAMIILLIMITLIGGGLFGVQTGISDLFVKNLSVKTVIPGMPSLPSMFAFILFGIFNILLLFESPNLKQRLLYLGISIILIGLTACFGYLFKIPILYYELSGIGNPISLNSAILFVLLGFGLILSGRNQKNENKL